jgi:hypothetical protein
MGADTFSLPQLGAAVVEDTEGAKLPLGRLWADRPAVLAFVRHFG